MKIKCASFETEIANCKKNTDSICEIINKSVTENVDILLFQELSITGYSCADMFYNSDVLKSAIDSLLKIKDYSRDNKIFTIVGLPIVVDSNLYDCGAIIYNGEILGIIPKGNILNCCEFYDSRWFSSFDSLKQKNILINGHEIPFGKSIVFKDIKSNVTIGVEIGEDNLSSIDFCSSLTLNGANIILNLSTSSEFIGKNHQIKNLIETLSLLNNCVYVYCSGNSFESTTDIVYSDYKGIAMNGRLIKESNDDLLIEDIDISSCISARLKSSFFKNGKNLEGTIIPFIKGTYCDELPSCLLSKEPFIQNYDLDDVCNNIISIQKKALYKKMKYTSRNKLIIGISGGLDSTIALLSCVKLFNEKGFDSKNIIGVTMPGPGTTARTYNNSLMLMKALNISIRDINISDAVADNLRRIGHKNNDFDITYEQTQSRERTKILMDLANQEKGIVIGTGDLSEFALGWMTYTGDQISMYGLNCGIPKTVIYHLMDYYIKKSESNISKILMDIRDTPVSPELLPLSNNGKQSQKTEVLIGPYIIHDFFLYHFIKNNFSIEMIYKLAINTFTEYDSEKIKCWLKIFINRFFTRQFKRTCFSDGVQVFDISLSPRGYWRMPSDISNDELLKKVEELKL